MSRLDPLIERLETGGQILPDDTQRARQLQALDVARKAEQFVTDMDQRERAMNERLAKQFAP